jgi:hypothetical protein
MVVVSQPFNAGPDPDLDPTFQNKSSLGTASQFNADPDPQPLKLVLLVAMWLNIEGCNWQYQDVGGMVVMVVMV